jgi:hypothetical protein
MLTLNYYYLRYFFYISKKFHYFWNLDNVNLVSWDIRKNFKDFILFYKAPLWIFNIIAELESFVIVYYLLNLSNSSISLTPYGHNFNIFFKSNFFLFYINFYLTKIVKNLKVFCKIIIFNVKWILIAGIISIVYFFFHYFIFN